MMATKTKTYRWMLTLLSAIYLLTAFTACSTKEDGTGEIINPTPTEKKDDKNTITVTADGAKVSRGDFSINFPKGTFSKDAEVTVTTEKKGSTCGDYDVSDFYKVIMPAKCGKPLTIRIKSDKKDGGIGFVSTSEVYRTSILESGTHGVYLDATYENGEYKITLPETYNNEDDGNLTFSIGLANVPHLDGGSSGTRGTRAVDGKVDNIEWYCDIHPIDAVRFTSAQRQKMIEMKPQINSYIEDAVKKLHAVGIKVSKGHENPIDPRSSKPGRLIHVYFTYDSKHPEAYGFFDQDAFYDEYSTIEINFYKIFTDGIDETSIKQTIIHELSHYYQADYNPRSSWNKKFNQEEESMLYEAGAVWAEQFMNNGKLNGDFLLQYMPEFLQGLYDLDAIYGNLKKDKQYQRHGYALSTLLYYLTSPIGNMAPFGIDKTKIVELYNMWKTRPTATYYLLERWLSDHDSGFLGDTEQYDDFLLSILDGRLIKHKAYNPSGLAPTTLESKKITTDGVVEFPGTCLPFGCEFKLIKLAGYKNSKGEHSFKGKKIVVKQTKPDVRTYIIVQETVDGENFKLLDGKTVKGDSLVIQGVDLEKTFESGKLYGLYTVSITTSSTKKETNVTCEVADADISVSPAQLDFPAEGGTKKVKVTATGFKKFGCVIDDKDQSWLSRTLASGGIVEITAQPNDTGEPRSTEVKCFVTNVENSTDADRVYLPVKITQDANTGGMSDVHVKSVSVGLCVGTLTCQSVSSSPTPTYTTLGGFANLENVSFSQSGSTVHATYTTTLQTGLKKTLSFDIVNLTSSCENLKVRNFKYSEVDTDFELSVVLGDIPLKNKVSFISQGHDDLWTSWPAAGGMQFENTVAEGLKVISYTHAYADGSTYEYVGSPTDKIQLWVSIPNATIDKH